MDKQQIVFETLRQMNIPYSVTRHPAVFTIEEMDALSITREGDVCKNLFLRDDKGKRHFLVVLQKDKRADLKHLREQLACRNLSFASEERLSKYLGLSKGEVTPFGILNDGERKVEVVFDRDLTAKQRLGIHPNDNTATVWIAFEDLKRVIEQHQNPVHYVDIE